MLVLQKVKGKWVPLRAFCDQQPVLAVALETEIGIEAATAYEYRLAVLKPRMELTADEYDRDSGLPRSFITWRHQGETDIENIKEQFVRQLRKRLVWPILLTGDGARIRNAGLMSRWKNRKLSDLDKRVLLRHGYHEKVRPHDEWEPIQPLLWGQFQC